MSFNTLQSTKPSPINNYLEVTSDTGENKLHSLKPKNSELKSIKKNMHEMNIKHAENDPSPLDSDENESEPMVIQSPIIKITENIEGAVSENKKILNDLNSVRERTSSSSKVSNTEGISLKKDESVFRSPKREQKAKNKLKAKEHSVRIKTKFTPGQIEFISEQLKDAIFSAWIGEREYVEKLRDYRDIIHIDEWEDNLNQRLKTVMYGVKGVMDGTKWINITVPSSISSCYCLWVLLESAPCPGHYWMQITSVNSDPEFGLKVSVKILREIHPFDGESKVERERRLRGETTSDEWREWVLSVTSLNLKALWMTLISAFTLSNISTVIRLLTVLSITLIVTFTKLLQHSWDFLLRFMREFGIFVHHTTPFAQSVIRCFEKIVGGFYLLLAMIYRDLRQPKGPSRCPYPPPAGRPFLDGSPRSPRRLTYVPPQVWAFNREDSD